MASNIRAKSRMYTRSPLVGHSLDFSQGCAGAVLQPRSVEFASMSQQHLDVFADKSSAVLSHRLCQMSCQMDARSTTVVHHLLDAEGNRCPTCIKTEYRLFGLVSRKRRRSSPITKTCPAVPVREQLTP